MIILNQVIGTQIVKRDDDTIILGLSHLFVENQTKKIFPISPLLITIDEQKIS